MEDSAITMDFSSMNVRDLAKSVLYNYIKPAEEVQKRALDVNADMKSLYSNIKTIISSSHFFKTNFCNKMPGLYQQKAPEDICSNNFIEALTQPLVDVFISMNYSLNQFYNLLTNSYFYDIKNQKNAIDRILFERIREFSGEIDYATRINSYSVMSMYTTSSKMFEAKEPKEKMVDFEPVFLCESKNEEVKNLPDYKLEIKELNCNFEADVIDEENKIQVEPKDFEVARDLCKVIYSTDDPETVKKITKFLEDFKEMLVGKYGQGVLKYVKRLIPTFYIKNR